MSLALDHEEHGMEIGTYGACTDEAPVPDDWAPLVEDAGIDALHSGEQ